MALALESRAMKDDLMLGDTPKAKQRRGRLRDVQSRGRLWKHSTLADLDGVVTADELPEIFVFTLVRNPWDRLVSYYHWLRAQKFEHPAVRLAQSLDFDAFARHSNTRSAFGGAPASSYVTDAVGVERCQAFIRLEHFAEDVAPLEAHLGFALSLGHENRSERKANYQEAYSDDLRHLVAEICAEDIARFGYTFG